MASQNASTADHNILSSLLSSTTTTTTHAPWTSTTNPIRTLSKTEALLYIARLAAGFDRMLIPVQATVLLISPPIIYTPIIYLATVASSRIYTSLPPTLSTEEYATKIQDLKPELILVDPNTALETVLDAVEISGTGLRDRVFSFEEDDWSDPKNGILDWKILMARAVDGRKWRTEGMDEKRARETAAVVGREGVAKSHWDVMDGARKITKRKPDVNAWDAVLPWVQDEMAARKTKL